jgi:hypothetical protein
MVALEGIMNATSQPPNGGLDNNQTTILLVEYEFARETRGQADTAAWEMTAIMWGGQTLLLGFALEAIEFRSAQPLIMLLAAVGVLLSCYNHVVMQTRSLVAREMVSVCAELEDLVGMNVKPQHRIDLRYPKNRQTTWFYVINFSFAAVWIFAGLRAGAYYCQHWGR